MSISQYTKYLEHLGVFISTLKFAEETSADSHRRWHITNFYKNLCKALLLGNSIEPDILKFVDFCMENDRHSYSQVQQDLWTLYMLDSKRKGFFVEFGAADGLEHSNTYILEKYFGWTGILVEPIPEYFEKLTRHRSPKTSKYRGCIAIDDNRQCELIVPEYGQFASISGYQDLDSHSNERKKNSRHISVKAYQLNELLKAHAPSDKIIDYLSIDVEGAERDILERLNFERWQFRLITVEHNSRQCDTDFLQRFFSEKSYLSFENSLFTNNEYWFYRPDLCALSD